MEIMKKIFRKIRLYIYYMEMYFKCYISCKTHKNKMFIIGTPKHGNIGDQAILCAEKLFIEKNFKRTKIIELESSFYMKYINKIKKYIDNKAILLVHGGGFLGTLWKNEEMMFRSVITEFPNNEIIVFPQTIYFSDDEDGVKTYEESKEIYSKNKKLTICCREKYSYKYMNEKFPDLKVILVPDIVLYNDFYSFDYERKDALFCLRSDKEKIDNSFEVVKDVLKKNNINIEYTDTVINYDIYTNNKRNKILINKLKQFSTYKIVITDRLHGIIFAYITKTPCIVFENKSYKIRGVYDWIKECNYIRMYNEEKIENIIQELLIEENKKGHHIIEEFNPLTYEIQSKLENGGENE